MVMQGGAAPDPAFRAAVAAFVNLEEGGLQDDGEALHEENAAQQGQEQFLPEKDRAHADHAAEGKRSGIPHEDGGRIAVVPQETQQGAYHRCHKDGDFTGARQVHNVEVFRIDEVARQPGQDTDDDADDGRSPRGEAVQAVRQVDAVGARRDDEDDHQHVDRPFCIPAHRAFEGGEPFVIEFVGLHERNGGLGGFDHILLGVTARGNDLFLRPGGIFHLFPDHDIGAHPHGQADHETEDDLAEQLYLTRYPFLVLLDGFDIIVCKSQGPAPEQAEDQQQDVDIGQVGEHQHTEQDAKDDDNPAEARRILLLVLPRCLRVFLPLSFQHVFPASELLHKPIPEDQREGDCENARENGPE